MVSFPPSEATAPAGHRLRMQPGRLRIVCREALELLGALTHFFNVRAEALEAGGMTPEEAEQRAKIETQATETYRRWLALG